MNNADGKTDTETFCADVKEIRKRLEKAKQSGILTDDLKESIENASRLQAKLLAKALPVYRRLHLNDDSLGVKKTIVLEDLNKLSEADLDEKTRILCARLAKEEDPGMPELPVVCGFDPADFDETFFLCVKTDESAFVFGDEGDVLLFEKNEGQWDFRRKPLLSGCFVTGAVMESDSSCLVKNLDNGVDRIAYDRMDDAHRLAKVPLFAGIFAKEPYA
ncbi:MAG: hypothetical protein PUB14_01950 [Lachnospiraceae bacterium]|nr:hypothetical protein [Lachnospiraceae bacterium]